MEITITDGDGIPEGSILSIKCGSVHCQATLEYGRPIYVPCAASKKKEEMSIGLLQEVCRQKLARPTVLPGQDPQVVPVEFKV